MPETIAIREASCEMAQPRIIESREPPGSKGVKIGVPEESRRIIAPSRVPARTAPPAASTQVVAEEKHKSRVLPPPARFP